LTSTLFLFLTALTGETVISLWLSQLSVVIDGRSVFRYTLFMAQPKVVPSLGLFPVGAAEVAERLRVKPQTVHTWRQRRLMPEPRWTVSGQPAWDWAEIEAWARQTGRLRETDPYSQVLQLEGSGWTGNLDEMRVDRVEKE
jgi:hypothetical protein